MVSSLAIIGAGMAAARLLQELAAQGFDAPITVFGAEQASPYNRILLSSVLAGEKTVDGLPLLDADWYARHRVTLRCGDAVSAIDSARREVITASGYRQQFAAIVLATGAAPALPQIPGVGLSGVMAFRTLHDVTAMCEFAQSQTAQAVVVGGGLLGLEAAYGLHKRGVAVSVVHHRSQLMNRQLDQRAGALLRRQLQARGIAVHTGAQLREICGDEQVEAVLLDNGQRLAAQLVVLATGIRPNCELARAAGLGVARGVLVDDQLRCSVEAIYALGECCEHREETVGIIAPIAEQAAVLAKTLCGEVAVYARKDYATQLKVSGVELFSAGDVSAFDRRAADANARQIEVYDPDAGVYRRLLIADGRLQAALLYGDKRFGRSYEALIHRQESVAACTPDLLFNPEAVAPRSVA